MKMNQKRGKRDPYDKTKTKLIIKQIQVINASLSLLARVKQIKRNL